METCAELCSVISISHELCVVVAKKKNHSHFDGVIYQTVYPVPL
jgi:hypothetical protein